MWCWGACNRRAISSFMNISLHSYPKYGGLHSAVIMRVMSEVIMVMGRLTNGQSLNLIVHWKPITHWRQRQREAVNPFIGHAIHSQARVPHHLANRSAETLLIRAFLFPMCKLSVSWTKDSEWVVKINSEQCPQESWSYKPKH